MEDSIGPERIPPCNMAAEQSLLGACLLEGIATILAMEAIGPLDFYRKAHQIIFVAICKLSNRGAGIDEVTVIDELGERLEDVGGADYLHELVTNVPSAANIEQYIEIVKHTATRRRLASALSRSLRDVEKPGDIAQVLDATERRIYGIAGAGRRSSVEALDEIISDEVEDIAEARRSTEPLRKISTHLPGFDALTGGFHPSEYNILAARPSVGKTALALNMLYDISAMQGHPSLLFSLEMSKKQIGLRLLSSVYRVPFFHLRNRVIEDADWGRLLNALDSGGLNIYVDDTSRLTLPELRSKARHYVILHKIEVVVIDFIQLMKAPDAKTYKSREREVAEISSSLKALSKELDITVLAICQLNRNAEERLSGEPQLNDLRESGTLEQDGDNIFLLHRQRRNDGTRRPEGKLTIAKQRNGPTGIVPLQFVPDYMTFMESAIPSRG